MSTGSNENTGSVALKTQETILLELEMILTTVKQIDSNILKSIELLAGNSTTTRSSIGSIDQTTRESYGELVRKNTAKISEILRMLDSI